MTDNAFTLDAFAVRYPEGAGFGPWTFSLEKGRSGALLGPSGSGKTSLLYSLAGLEPGGPGSVTVTGCRRVSGPVDLLFERPFLQILGPRVKDEMRAAEEDSGIPPETRKQERQRLLEAFSLDSLWDRSVRELSEGERQKLALSCLFLRSPALMLLDQPASCLDRKGRNALKDAIERATARGVAVLAADPDWKSFMRADAKRLSLLPQESRLPGGMPGDRLFAVPGPREGFPGETLLAFEGLEIRRGGRTVLRGISGRVRRGEIIALTGDNGSGKTSLLLTIAGLLKPGAGRWIPPYPRRGRLRRNPRRPALMLQEPLWHLSGKPVTDELAWAGKGRSRRGGISPETLASLLRLEDVSGRPGPLLSRGEMQRVALAMAMLRKTPLTCLDEPFRFLWDQERKDIARLFRIARNRGHSLLIATPADEGFSWADQVWRLDRGRMEICTNAPAYDTSATPWSSAPCGAQ